MSALLRTLRAAISTFTIVPVGRVDIRKGDGGLILCWLTLLGGVLGCVGGLVFVAVISINDRAGLLAATLAVAVLALLTRGLHLDGLADTADGLGSRAPADQALEIMRRSDIGPFGVVSIMVVFAVDVAALVTFADHRWHGLAVLVIAATTGRLTVAHAALPGVPTARPGGFGALVAGTHTKLQAVLTTLIVLGVGEAMAVVAHLNLLAVLGIQAAGLLIAFSFRVHVTRRIGGVTGDVFGALVEIGTAATLIGLGLLR